VVVLVVVVLAAQRVLLVPTVQPAVWQVAAEAAMLLTVRATTVPRPCPFSSRWVVGVGVCGLSA